MFEQHHDVFVGFVLKYISQNKNETGFSSGNSTSWLFLSSVSRSNWNLQCWFLWREEK